MTVLFLTADKAIVLIAGAVVGVSFDTASDFLLKSEGLHRQSSNAEKAHDGNQQNSHEQLYFIVDAMTAHVDLLLQLVLFKTKI